MLKSFFKKVFYPKTYSIHIVIQLVLSFVLIASILSIKLYNIGYAKSETSNYDPNILFVDDEIESENDKISSVIETYKEKIKTTISKTATKSYFVYTVPYLSYKLLDGSSIHIVFYDGDINKIVGFNSYNAYIEKTYSNNGVYVSDIFKGYIAYSILTYKDGMNKSLYDFNEISGFIKNIPEGQENVIYIPISYFDVLVEEEIVESDIKLRVKLLYEFDNRVITDDIVRLNNNNINASCHDSNYNDIISSYENIFSVINYFLIASAAITIVSVVILLCMKIYNNRNSIYIESIYYGSNNRIIINETIKNLFILLISIIISLFLILVLNLIILLVLKIGISISTETLLQMLIVGIVVILISVSFTGLVIFKNNKQLNNVRF